MGKRILIVDDERDILEFVGYNLSREGYEVYTAENGAVALEVAERVHPLWTAGKRARPFADIRC